MAANWKTPTLRLLKGVCAGVGPRHAISTDVDTYQRLKERIYFSTPTCGGLNCPMLNCPSAELSREILEGAEISSAESIQSRAKTLEGDKFGILSSCTAPHFYDCSNSYEITALPMFRYSFYNSNMGVLLQSYFNGEPAKRS